MQTTLYALSAFCVFLAMLTAFNAVQVDTRKVGGLRFIKIGRLTLSYSVARSYRPIGG